MKSHLHTLFILGDWENYPSRDVDDFFPQVKAGYRHKGTDIYWKIGLAIDDVQSASERLGCGPGSQFLDIGFLTHLADPAGGLTFFREIQWFQKLPSRFLDVSGMSCGFLNVKWVTHGLRS